MDIHEHCRQYARDGIIVEIGSQDDPGFLGNLVRHYPPRIIIDDGSHQAHHVIFTFETLFPSVEAGGIYIVEDLHFHGDAMAVHWRGWSEVNPIDYFMALARAVVMTILPEEKRWGFNNYALRSIEEVVFFGRAVAIRKKAKLQGDKDRVASVAAFAEQQATADGWEKASYYLSANGHVPEAIAALGRAIEIAPRAKQFVQLSQLHYSKGERGIALELVQAGVEHPGEPLELSECWEHLGNMLIVERQFGEGVDAFRKALSFANHPVVSERIEKKIAQYSGC